MRLIDADALMAFARNHVNHAVDCNDIARFPQIEDVPVVHGKWRCESYLTVWYGPGEAPEWVCTGCGERALNTYDYCPDCGARMDADTAT